jgi:hypothetical protein
MNRSKTAISINFVVASVLVWLAILYARWTGIPIDDFCMGFHRRARMFNPPAWVAPAMFQAIALALFAGVRILEPDKERVREIRLFIGIMSAVGIFFFILPKILPVESVWTGSDHSYGVILWIYACASNILLAVSGRWRDES